jgi:NADH-quinone oxidoreductase subunit L
MLDLLFLVCVFPLAGFLILAFGRGRIPELPAAIVGVGSIGLSFLVTIGIGIEFLSNPPEGHAHTQVLWTWMQVESFAPRFALYLDGLSLTMMGVVTGVGFFIHLFAAWYMRGDEGYDRFFSYMNLFVASMLFLVLADDLLFLFFGWEGVGLCSYLLIGFWYRDPANGGAARKAFIVTRAGDTFFSIGLFLIFWQLGTLNIQDILVKAPNTWEYGSLVATLVGLLLLGGAAGKSAQAPLHTWLPDAMAGPTPVSALIHAATMVTAGVYLIARLHTVYELAPVAQQAVAWVGAIGLLLAAFAGLAQRDIKRILAYSTMSQIAYMFLALGVGAWSIAIFHLMTHAFFKALLFLAAGSVILAMHHEQDIFRMGGLRKQMPLVFAVFVIGALALVAAPPTAGFFSKDEILWEAWASGNRELFWCGLAGAFLTALYTFRMIFVVFFGEPKGEVHASNGASHTLPLVVLAVFSVIGGFIALPLDAVLPKSAGHAGGDVKHLIALASVGVSAAGIALAWFLYVLRPRLIAAATANPLGNGLRRYWFAAWGFDWFYDRLFTRPFSAFNHWNRHDGVDGAVALVPAGLQRLHGWAALTQNGRIRWYAAGLAAGAVLFIAGVLL